MLRTYWKVALVATGLLTASSTWAGVYEWRDAQGKVHYSDQPPVGVDAKTIRTQPASPKPSAANKTDDKTEASKGKPASLAEEELAFKERRAKAAEQETETAKEKEQQAAREKSCAQAKAQTKALQAGERIGRINADGKREMLDDAAREEEIQRHQQYIEESCQ